MGLTLDEPIENDVIEEINGIKVAIDFKLVDEVKKVTLDFQEDGLVLMGTDSCC